MKNGTKYKIKRYTLNLTPFSKGLSPLSLKSQDKLPIIFMVVFIILIYSFTNGVSKVTIITKFKLYHLHVKHPGALKLSRTGLSEINKNISSDG
jgi:hypothetical protein